MKKLNVLFVVLLQVLNVSCLDLDDMQDYSFQEGTGKISAVINGTPWYHMGLPYTRLTPTRIGFMYNPGGVFQLKGVSYDYDFSNGVIIELKKVNSLGNYPLSEEASGRFAHYWEHKTPNENYFTTSTSTGIVTITKLDKEARFISGTFSFKAQNKNDPSEFVDVTDGYFEVSY